ncbi:MAG: hypothetical protein LBS73_03730, partial [Campylobacteraceae bacterium]|nr:hypothetical protein [Campylobacteraceae bacterium]
MKKLIFLMFLITSSFANYGLEYKEEKVADKIEGLCTGGWFVFTADLYKNISSKIDITFDFGMPNGRFCKSDGWIFYINDSSSTPAGTYPVYITYTGTADSHEMDDSTVSLFLSTGYINNNIKIEGVTLRELDALENGYFGDVVYSGVGKATFN